MKRSTFVELCKGRSTAVGYGSVQADTNKLKNDYDLICAGEVELTTLAVSTLKNTSLKRSGIATLAEKVLGVSYKKNKRATMSNWEIRDLTYAQIQYAAADAWLSYSILMALLNHKEVPAAPPPTLKSDNISSGNMVHHSPTRYRFHEELFCACSLPFKLCLHLVMLSRVVATCTINKQIRQGCC